MQGTIRERERERESLEIVDQSQTPGYVSRFEPMLFVPAFTQKDSTNASTQGTSIEDLGNINLGYTTPFSNNNNLYIRGKTLSHRRSTSQ